MKGIPLRLFLVLSMEAVLSFSFCPTEAKGDGKYDAALKVIIIRHGEKAADGDNLSCQGLNRALQLPRVLNAKFGMPDRTYIPAVNGGGSTSHVRMLQTVTPFAVRYNLKLNSKFDVTEGGKLARDVLTRKGTVLVVWEHEEIPNIAQALGVNAANLNWKDSDYDSVWIVTIHHGVATLTRDKEGLSPSPDCN